MPRTVHLFKVGNTVYKFKRYLFVVPGKDTDRGNDQEHHNADCAKRNDKLFLDFKTAKLGNGQKHRHGKEYASEICDIIGKYRKFHRFGYGKQKISHIYDGNANVQKEQPRLFFANERAVSNK